nr:MAG TPA: hypothetical protein [Bacteriophage sp.]
MPSASDLLRPYSTQFHKSVFSIVVEPFSYFVLKQNLETWLLIIQY